MLNKYLKGMRRDEGYYWVRKDLEWTIAGWDTYYWSISGLEGNYSDHDFDEIDERQIRRDVLGSVITYTPSPYYDGRKLNGLQMDEEGQTLHQTAYKRVSYDYTLEALPHETKCHCGCNTPLVNDKQQIS